jgi:hypothetical protein
MQLAQAQRKPNAVLAAVVLQIFTLFGNLWFTHIFGHTDFRYTAFYIIATIKYKGKIFSI